MVPCMSRKINFLIAVSLYVKEHIFPHTYNEPMTALSDKRHFMSLSSNVLYLPSFLMYLAFDYR